MSPRLQTVGIYSLFASGVTNLLRDWSAGSLVKGTVQVLTGGIWGAKTLEDRYPGARQEGMLDIAATCDTLMAIGTAAAVYATEEMLAGLPTRTLSTSGGAALMLVLACSVGWGVNPILMGSAAAVSKVSGFTFQYLTNRLGF